MAYSRKSMPWYIQYFYQSDISAAEDNGSTEVYYRYEIDSLPKNGSKTINLTEVKDINEESPKNPINNSNILSTMHSIQFSLKDTFLNADWLTNLKSFDDVIPTVTSSEIMTSPNSDALANHEFGSGASGDVTESMTSLKSIINVVVDEKQSFNNRSEKEHDYYYGSVLKSNVSSNNHWNNTGLLGELIAEKNDKIAAHDLHTDKNRDDSNVGFLLDDNDDEYWDAYEQNYIQKVSTYDYYAAVHGSDDNSEYPN